MALLLDEFMIAAVEYLGAPLVRLADVIEQHVNQLL